MKLGKKPCIKIMLLFTLLVLFTAASLFMFPTAADFSMERERLMHVLLKIRLPELMIAVTAGASLGLAGALMQLLIDNPLFCHFFYHRIEIVHFIPTLRMDFHLELLQ